MPDELDGQIETPENSFDFESLSDYGKSFLQNYPEEQWPVLGGALQRWDSGFTKKMQEVHNEYAPYKNLGDPEYVSQAVTVAKMLQDDPVGIYQRMLEAGLVDPSALGFNGNPTQDTNPTGAEIPPELEQRFSKYDGLAEQFNTFQKTLESITGWVSEQRTAQQRQQDDVAVENLFNGLKAQHGDFDEDYVASRILKGRTPEEAVKDYQGMVQKIRGDRATAPVVLGPGGMPRTQKPPSKMSNDEVQSFITAALQAQNRG